MKYKKFSIALILTLIISLIPSLTTKAASAPAPSNAQALINMGVKEQKLYVADDGRLYFWQKGVKRNARAEYYTIIGLELEATYNGKTFSGTLGTDRMKEVRTEVNESGVTYVYSLVSIAQASMAQAFWEAGNSSQNLVFIYGKAYSMVMNAIVTNMVPNGSGGFNAQGAINTYTGAYRWGNVYTGESIKYNPNGSFKTTKGSMPSWMEGIRSEISNLWNVKANISADKTYELFLIPSANIIKKSDTSAGVRAHYDSGNVRWVNAREPFAISSVIVSYGNGADFASELDGADGSIMTLQRYEGNYEIKTNSNFSNSRDANSISLDTTSNFTLNDFKGATSRTGGTPKTLNTTILVKANASSDGSTYILKAQGYFDRNGTKVIGDAKYAMDGSNYQILAVDNRAPDTPYGASNLDVGQVDTKLIIQANSLRDITTASSNTGSWINGSGIARVYATVDNGNGDLKIVELARNGSNADGYIDVRAHYGEHYGGTYTIKFYGTDNVGNTGLIGTKVANVSPDLVSKVLIIDNDTTYRNSSTKTFWTRPGVNFEVLVEGSRYGNYPTGSQLRLAKSKTNIDDFYLSHTMYRNFPDRTGNVQLWKNDLGNENYIERAGYQAEENFRLNYSISGSKYYTGGKHYLRAHWSAHGMYFYPYGVSEFGVNNIGTFSSWSYEANDYRIGVDGAGPTAVGLAWSRNSEAIRISDEHSGVRWWEITVYDKDKLLRTITGDGSTANSINIDLTNAYKYCIYSVDNVGNSSWSEHGPKGKIKASISAVEKIVGNKKVLEFSYNGDDSEVTGELKPIVGKYEVTGSNQVSSAEANLSFTNKTLIVNDIYNTTEQPGLSFETDEATYAKLNYSRINDITYTYTGKLSSKMKVESSFTQEATLSKSFSSGENTYQIKLNKLKEFDGSSVISAFNKTYTRTKSEALSVDTSDMLPGQYEALITMYDYNNNPSGTKRITFNFPGLYKLEEKDVEITEIKDVAWMKESYPMVYSPDKFPIGGKTLNRLGMSIKQGYAITYRIKLPFGKMDNVQKIQLNYSYKDTENNKVLSLYDADGKSLELYHDSRAESPTKFYSKDSDYVVKDGYAYVQHFVPANVKYKVLGSSAYTTPNNVVVNLKVTLTFSNKASSIDIPLYQYYTSETALDDLEGKIQR